MLCDDLAGSDGGDGGVHNGGDMCVLGADSHCMTKVSTIL